jgi:hypothetical protein
LPHSCPFKKTLNLIESDNRYCAKKRKSRIPY